METDFGSLDSGHCDVSQISRGHDHIAGNAAFDQTKLVHLPVKGNWAETLKRTIESEIIPHILTTQRAAGAQVRAERPPGHPSDADVAAFVALIMADDMEQVRAVADRVIVLSGGRDALLHELLAPAAQLLGAMWERDICDFTAVTLGVLRLDQIMKETASGCTDDYCPAQYDRSILLLPAPGEQHSFGLNMVADVFRAGGWCVRSGPSATRAQLARLVSGEWFDLVGLSVASERALKHLPACIRAIRQASCNPELGVFIGGQAVGGDCELVRFLGADALPNEPRQALAEANIFVEATVTKRLHQSKTKLVDIG